VIKWPTVPSLRQLPSDILVLVSSTRGVACSLPGGVGRTAGVGDRQIEAAVFV
jgi:hypothetical protein